MTQAMHLDDERRQRLLHGELAPAEEAAARAHVARCGECRDRLALEERDEAELLALLGALDDEPRRVTAVQVAGAARSRGSGWGRWAAGLVLTLGAAGAAWALPGSPVRPWVTELLGLTAPNPQPDAELAPVAQPDPSEPGPARDPAGATPPGADPATAGLMVEPGQALLIEFTSPRATGSVRVVLGDGDLVEAIAIDGAASFESDVDRLVIGNAESSGNFEIVIPRDAPRVEIRVAGRSVFLKEGQRITSGTAESGGAWVIPLSIGAGGG